MSLISKWYSSTLAFGTDSQNTPEIDLLDSFEAIEIDIPTLSVAAEVQIKGSNTSGGTFDLIGQEEPIPSSLGGFRTTVTLGGKYQFIKVYTSVAQTADAIFAVRGISYASAGLVALLDRIKNMRIDIGDIEVNTSDIEDGIDELKVITEYTQKAEDVAHTTGDKGIMALGVRKDVAGSLVGTDEDYASDQYDQDGYKRVVSGLPMFGQPTLKAQGNGIADWERGTTVLSTYQKGTTGWVARLYGGLQTGWDDAAELYIPVNEMHLTDLDACMWSWFQTAAEDIGLTMVVFAHDPTDFDKRAEITMEALSSQMEVGAGWNAHELASTHTFIHYGENLSGNTTCPTEATPYTWAQYQADPMFLTWTIFRIAFSWGFLDSSTVMDDAYVADVKINGTVVPLKPSVEEQLDIMRDDQVKALTTIPTWKFGTPTLRDSGHGQASWTKWHLQRPGTGWQAQLYGGVQSGYDDWACVQIPVNELPISKLRDVMWSWYTTEQEDRGCGMIIYMHDPLDNDSRVELTMHTGILGFELAAGWNAHELDLTADQWYWYGENAGDSGLSEGAAYVYGIDDYAADAEFGSWTIYRIEFCNGGHTGNEEFKNIYLCDVKINGTVIPMGPPSGKHKKTVITTKTMIAGAVAAGDVVSNAATGDSASDWDFEIGGTGYITKAIISLVASIIPRTRLHLWTVPPSEELDNNDPFNGPNATSLPDYVGSIEFPAMSYNGSGESQAICTPSTVGNLPLAFDGIALFGILVSVDGATWTNTLCTIILTADMEDN